MNSDRTKSVESDNTIQTSVAGLTRRQMVIGGAAIAGLTTAIVTGTAQANTQKPPEPSSNINPKICKQSGADYGCDIRNR